MLVNTKMVVILDEGSNAPPTGDPSVEGGSMPKFEASFEQRYAHCYGRSVIFQIFEIAQFFFGLNDAHASSFHKSIEKKFLNRTKIKKKTASNSKKSSTIFDTRATETVIAAPVASTRCGCWL